MRFMKKGIISVILSIFIASNLLWNFGLIAKADPITLSSITLNGATVPVAGAVPDFTCEVPAGENYTLSEIRWFNDSDSDWMSETDVFEIGKSYHMIAHFIPKEGYSFDDVYNITANLSGIDSSLYDTRIYEAAFVNRSVYYLFKIPGDGTCKVVFDSNGGFGVMDDIVVSEGEKITLPECTFTPPSSDYIFDKWSYGPVGTQVKIKENCTIYAKWKLIPEKYIKSVSLKDVILPKPGEKPCYTAIISDDVNYSLSNNIKWFNDSDSVWMSETDVFEIGKKYHMDVLYIPNEGYCFDSVEDMTASLEGIDSSLYNYIIYSAAVDNRSVYYIFECKDYHSVSVTSDGNGEVTSSVNIGIENDEVSLTATPKKNYKFKEWQIVSGGVTVVDNKFKIGKEDVEIKAIFEKISYQISFDTAGGSSIASQKVTIGNKAVKPEDPQKEGYTFDGWYADKNCSEVFDFGKEINSDLTVYAKWNKNPAPTESPKPTPSSEPQDKPISEDGIGTISEDGKTLTDTDGDEYLVAEKITEENLVKNTAIADKSSAGKYKITKVTKKKGKITGGTVTYMKPYNKNSTSAVVKDTVKLGGVKFKVTVIANNAFKGSKIKKLTIGKYITQIGKNAANGCADLKNIKIKTKVLKKIGGKAFKGINAKAKFKVTAKNKVKKYKKMIKKAGAPKKAKVTK